MVHFAEESIGCWIEKWREAVADLVRAKDGLALTTITEWLLPSLDLVLLLRQTLICL